MSKRQPKLSGGSTPMPSPPDTPLFKRALIGASLVGAGALTSCMIEELPEQEAGGVTGSSGGADAAGETPPMPPPLEDMTAPFGGAPPPMPPPYDMYPPLGGELPPMPPPEDMEPPLGGELPPMPPPEDMEPPLGGEPPPMPPPEDMGPPLGGELPPMPPPDEDLGVEEDMGAIDMALPPMPPPPMPPPMPPPPPPDEE